MTQPNSTPRLRPVIRVFVSSTFSDLKPERNALQAQVFPKLEQLCAQNGFQFQAIDLRWGVSSEAGLDHRTMRICFDELRRAQEISPRPNFLILLGNRYGWRPLPEEIAVDEFQALERAAAQVATTTDQPVAAVLQSWYRRDENAVPPVYLLQSRRQQLPDAKDYTQAALWNEVQAVLWEIINRAMPPEQLRGRFDEAALPDGSPPAIVRFQASATEQEIWHGALRVPDAHEHVLAFFRQIENVGEFAEPTQIKDFVDVVPFGVPPLGGLGLGVPRSRGSEPPEGGTPNSELQTSSAWVVDAALGAEQERLKAALRKRLGGANVFETRSARLVSASDSQGRPTTDVSTDHLAQLCSDVENRLTQIIQGQIEEYWNKTAQASKERAACELKIEQDEHERFGRERGAEDSFVGRQTELQAILDYVRNDSPWPLVVHGASGCGKTALLARAVGEMQKEEGRMQKSGQTSQDSQPSTLNPQPICRFIGVTPRSSDVRSLLGSLCQELRLRHPREGELPSDTKALREEVHEQLRTATPEQPLILFLDALDQLSDADGGRLLNWIPAGPLPAHVKLVVSCLSDRAEGDPAGQPCAELRRRQLPAENLINLDALSEDEARTLLFDRWLHQAERTVSPDQSERIEKRLGSAVCRQPIYLKFLFEEVRMWRSYDAVPKLGESVPAILGQLIKRLSQPANHGALLVKLVLGYLGASRHGLAENEILEILFIDADYKTVLKRVTKKNRHELPASATRIPIAIWSRLRFDLAPYLTERAAVGANVLTFYHRQLAEWVQEHFAKSSDQSWQPHQRLADYFVGCAQGSDPGKRWETLAVRGFAECVFHLTKAERYDQAAEVLTNFPFLLHKLRVGLLDGVFDDYGILSGEAPAEVMKRLEIWAEFFREKAHILRRGKEEWPANKILLQLAVEHADDSPLGVGAEQWLTEGHCDWLWLRRVSRLAHAQKNPCRAVMEGHTAGINGALALSDGSLLSWSDDHTLRLWDACGGQCLRILKGHTDRVAGALALSNGRLVSWTGFCLDAKLRMWDATSGTCQAILEGHTGVVYGALELSDGRLLSWSHDATIRVWDVQSGSCLVVVKEHAWYVNGALELSNGQLLSWGNNNTLRISNRKTGECLALLRGHEQQVNGALVLEDARILSWSDDHSIRIWDLKRGLCVAVLEGQHDRVYRVRVLSGGRLLSCQHHTLRVWDASSGLCLAVLDGHTGHWVDAQELSDGRLLSWSDDNTLRLWDGHSGAFLAVLKGHTGWCAMGARELAGGRLLSWSDDATLRLWDGQSGVCRAVLEGHTDEVNGVLELSDCRLLSWSRDGTLRVWDSQSEGRPASIERHTKRVNGVLALGDGRMVSWSDDETLRLWDGQNGACLAVMEGHRRTGGVRGALALADGRLLSWAQGMRLWDDQSGACLAVLEGHTGGGVLALTGGDMVSWGGCDDTLQLWDGRSGACLKALRGHHDGVKGAMELSGRRLLSIGFLTLRVWDIQSATCLAVFEGHIGQINGALELANGRLLSWAGRVETEERAVLDGTLRLWDSQSGSCLGVLEGHTWDVSGALELSDGHLLSWSEDKTLRLWDAQSGACLAVFKGHTDRVSGALELTDGRLLSWSGDKCLHASRDKMMRLWDNQSGACLEIVPEEQIARRHPEWLHARTKIEDTVRVHGDFIGDLSLCSAHLRHRTVSSALAIWEADSDAATRCLLPDGTVVVTQDKGLVCILKLHHGQRRVTLAEAEALLASQMKKVE